MSGALPPAPQPLRQARPLALFISYSHRDDRERVELETHLALLKRQKVFDVWHDRRIAPGQEWAGEIDAELERADVVLLLVSAHFLASDYCYVKEMTRALERHEQRTARVVPVILKPCDWRSSPFGRLQALPRDGLPVTEHASADAALAGVAAALRVLAEEMRRTGIETPSPATGPVAAAPAAEASGPAAARPAGLPGEAAAPAASAPPPETATPPQDDASQQKLKVGSIKLWGIELPPFEFDRRSLTRAPVLAGLIAMAAAVLGLAYLLALEPALDEARDLMRRADYAGAVKAVDAAPSWLQQVPWLADLGEQARFGLRLVRAKGKEIDTLAAELEGLRKRFPRSSDVLVFEGSKAYYDGDPRTALDRFVQAADIDPAHVEAHFLAAGRQLDLAYGALARGDPAQARSAVAEAHRLIERAVQRAPFAKTLSRYANAIGDLQELEGDWRGAYATYAVLAAKHPLSGVQAALLSWRLPGDSEALRNGLEAAETALAQLDQDEGTGGIEGWPFRVGATQLVDLRPKAEKLCLLAWTVAISQSLQAGGVGAAPSADAASAAAPAAFSPERCGRGALADRVRQVVCVQVLTALQATPPSEAWHGTLQAWRSVRLGCAAELRPLPVLARQSVSTTRAVPDVLEAST